MSIALSLPLQGAQTRDLPGDFECLAWRLCLRGGKRTRSVSRNLTTPDGGDDQRQCARLTVVCARRIKGPSKRKGSEQEERVREQVRGVEPGRSGVCHERLESRASRVHAGVRLRQCCDWKRMEANLWWARRRRKRPERRKRPQRLGRTKRLVRVRDRSERSLGHVGTYRACGQARRTLRRRRGCSPAPWQGF